MEYTYKGLFYVGAFIVAMLPTEDKEYRRKIP